MCIYMKCARELGFLTSVLCALPQFLQRQQQQRFVKIVEVALETNLGNRGE